MAKLQLQSPLKTKLSINQYFGQNATSLYAKEGLPGHNGIDFSASHGQAVYASHDGRAYFEIDQGGGHGVVLVTSQQYDYQNSTSYFKSIYWHFCDSLKEPQYRSPIQDFVFGKAIKCGDLLGYADNTGASTGDHLHFGLKPVAQGEDPNSWSNSEQNNGYQGAIDPFPYFDSALGLIPITPQHVPIIPVSTPQTPQYEAYAINPSWSVWYTTFYKLMYSYGFRVFGGHWVLPAK